MKILILTNNDVGLYRFRKELIEKLLEEHEVVISLPYGPYVKELESIGCKYCLCEFNRRGTNPVDDINLYKFYKTLLKSEKPDVTLTYTIKPNIYGGMACSSLGIPYMPNVTGLGTAIENKGPFQWLTLFLYKYGLRKAKTVFFQNESNMNFMKKYVVVRSNCILIPGSGVNLETNPFEPYPTDESQINFITIGRIMKDKGIDEILDAAERIKKKHNNVKFILVGGFDENYKEKIERFENESIIEYAGEQKDVHRFIKNSFATIHASYHEGLSNVLLESAASGRPVLATNVPGCKETYDDGISGLSFNSHSVDDLVRAIERFLTLSNQEKATMGRKGRKKMEKEFDRQIVINSYLKAIRSIDN